MRERKTILSEDRVYRYVLWREWDMTNLNYVMFIGLNPSTADETKDDPTIRKCIGFAKRWGAGALCMVNLFAYRATKPKDMMKLPHPQAIGWKNGSYISMFAKDAKRIIAAWGANGRHQAGSSRLITELDNDERNRLECLRKLKDGQPEHPLYVPYSISPQPWP